jgi:anti-sigma regulatory factor (Ser/Thr protein kinase)
MNAALWLNGVEADFPHLIEFAEEFADRCELPAGERARLLIILEELFTNAVSYGCPNGRAPIQIAIALAAKPGRIKIDFSDDGRPFDPLAQQEPEFGGPPAGRAEGGLGLHILRSLADEARYRYADGRNRLTLIRKLPRAG